jgi:hypothetical protein
MLLLVLWLLHTGSLYLSLTVGTNGKGVGCHVHSNLASTERVSQNKRGGKGAIPERRRLSLHSYQNCDNSYLLPRYILFLFLPFQTRHFRHVFR